MFIVRFGLVLNQLQCCFRLVGAVGQIAQRAFDCFAGIALVMKGALRITLGLFGGFHLILHRLQLFFESFGEFAQLRGDLPFPPRDIDRLDTGQFGVPNFRLQRGYLRLRVVQCPFRPVPSGCFGSERGFGALQAAGLRGVGIGGGIPADNSDRNFSVLHETAAMETLIAPYGAAVITALRTKSIRHTNGLFASIIVHTLSHATV